MTAELLVHERYPKAVCYSMARQLALPDEFYVIWEHPYRSSQKNTPRVLGIGTTVDDAWSDAATFVEPVPPLPDIVSVTALHEALLRG